MIRGRLKITNGFCLWLFSDGFRFRLLFFISYKYVIKFSFMAFFYLFVCFCSLL
ncbi:hypothetical protein NEIELOOT_02039 [Neisseria elongata subsp. glycolytica ATCC 29315]|uniref:Uncharacterized protein n=1 Tax=Neisseria elongata subsp. glycolytica ATCC 29315 TaxID=546263 RepID=D4DSJ4_NEIEG|nr:hypothetical protein NEIELOOT_02039 [Neisseria elongata subsp. glycolytica ATCC 29315]